jgi:predicted Fe-S protein YdhL (DUF1289 family)
MYNNYPEEAAASYMPAWSAVDATTATPMNDNASYAQQHSQSQQQHFGYATSSPSPPEAPLPTFVQHPPQQQPNSVRYFASTSVAPSPLAPFHSSFPEYAYVAQAPPTPGLDFLPSPINGNTPEWAFPSLDDTVRSSYVEGPALPRSAPIVAPLPISPAFGAYRPTPDVVSSPSDIGTEDIFGGRHHTQLHRPRHHIPLKQLSSGASAPVEHIVTPQAFMSPPPAYTSPSPSSRPSLEYASPSPPPQISSRRRRWTSDEEDEAAEDSDYKPPVRIAAALASKRFRHSPTATSPTSTSPRGRLSTTSHGCRPQTTLDPSCLLNTKMVRAPAKDDIDDQYKPFTCHYGHDGPNGACGKGFHKKNEWKRHLRTIHAWDEALQIQRGELSFQQAKLVQDPEAHKEMISEITRCFCAGCGKLFARPEILTRHWNNVEKAEKRKALKAAKEQAAIRAKARGSTAKRASR